MKSLSIVALAVFCASSSFAEPGAEAPCNDTVKLIAQALPDFCVLQHLKETDDKKLDEIAALKMKAGVNVVAKMATPSTRTSSTLIYNFPERELQPNDAICFGVPADMQGREVYGASIGHRQDIEKKMASGEYKYDERRRKQWDTRPGFTSLQFHGVGRSGDKAWRCWQGNYASSGPQSAKFAEPRSMGDTEIENLYEFRKYGHKDCITGAAKENGSLFTDGMCAINTGKSPVLLSEIMLKVKPPKADTYFEHAFTPGTSFGKEDTGIGQNYHAGQGMNGRYPEALRLNAYGDTGQPKLPNGWRMVDGRLHIPLPPGKSLLGYEIALGDTHDDDVDVPSEGRGTRGWAKLYADLKKKNGEVDVLMKRENVPPEGILLSAPKDACYKTKDGDELVVRAEGDAAQVMGIRLWFKDHK